VFRKIPPIKSLPKCLETKNPHVHGDVIRLMPGKILASIAKTKKIAKAKTLAIFVP
jgi:hypothetical protein